MYQQELLCSGHRDQQGVCLSLKQGSSHGQSLLFPRYPFLSTLIAASLTLLLEEQSLQLINFLGADLVFAVMEPLRPTQNQVHGYKTYIKIKLQFVNQNTLNLSGVTGKARERGFGLGCLRNEYLCF